MSLQFAAGGEGEEEEEALDTGAVLAAAAAAAEQWQESLEHLKHELSQCDEETKVSLGVGERGDERRRGVSTGAQGGGERATKHG